MISIITNLFVVPFRIISNILEGVWAIIRAIGLGLSLLTGEGTFASRAGAAFGQAKNQRMILTILRSFLPNFTLSKSFVASYENTGTAVVTRRDDVIDVLSRNDDFEVVYGPRMRKLTAGNNFFLGMQPGWDYTRDTSSMHLAMRRTDVAEIVLPRATELAEKLVKESGGKLDLPSGLTKQVPWDMTNTYFGTGGPSSEDMIEWTTNLFWYLFIDLAADEEFDKICMENAEAMREYLDATIATRKSKPSDAPDILNRCLALQGADTPGMDDLGIRNNILGLLIGAIPTISKASCLALDELLRRPDQLAGAQQAARDGNDELLAQYIWEALRFNPHNPVIYRRATRDTQVGKSTLRARTIKKGTMVFAANFSAMFDRYDIPSPNEFRTDRPWETYMIWGYGMHTCFGNAINLAVIPAILKPVLAAKNLRRAQGPAGEIDTQGTPFPVHFHVEFDT